MTEKMVRNGFEVLYDKADHDYIMSLNTYVSANHSDKYYEIRINTGTSRPSLARAIMKAPKGLFVMFRDRNRLNLQRDNMYLCTRSESQLIHWRNFELGLKAPIVPPKKVLKVEKRAELTLFDPKKWDQKKSVYRTAKAEAEARTKELVSDLIEHDAMMVCTWDTVSEVFKKWEPVPDPKDYLL